VGATTVRVATEQDLGSICGIYNWAIIDNHVTFDTQPYTVENRLQWWRDREAELTCLVAEIDGEVVGVAYSSWYRPKAAYRSSMETTIALSDGARGQGVGTVLLGELLDRLATQGVHRAVAVVALPNEASIALHHKLGYQTIGVLTEVGYKLGRYWDTEILEKQL